MTQKKLLTRLQYLGVLLFVILLSVVFQVWGFIISMVIIFLVARNHRARHEYRAPEPYIPIDILRVPPELFTAYREYLQSSEWHSLRQSAKKRDRFRCTRCGYIGNLQVHHIHYNGIYTMEFTLDQLETVCKECHNSIHSGDLPMQKKD